MQLTQNLKSFIVTNSIAHQFLPHCYNLLSRPLVYVGGIVAFVVDGNLCTCMSGLFAVDFLNLFHTIFAVHNVFPLLSCCL